jgi:hypothetical protein
LRANAPNIAEPVGCQRDDFLAHILSFPAMHSQESPLVPSQYDKALQQVRLGIKQGGCGLTSVAMPFLQPFVLSSLYGCMKILTPYCTPAWLLPHTDSYELAFLHVHHCFEMSSQLLVSK